jgi:uncharacterized protein Yka (UPF0111/DUF47 family)
MGFRLTPKEDRFFPLFSAVAQVALDATANLAQLVGADPVDRPGLAVGVRELEHRGDEATHAVIRSLAGSFITPFDRGDVYTLAIGLDDCVDRIDDAAQILAMYGISRLPERINGLLNAVTRMAQLTVEAMPRLHSPGDLGEYWIEVNRLENQVDASHRQAVADLLSANGDVVTTLKVKEFFDALRAAAAAFENVAHAIERVAVKGA